MVRLAVDATGSAAEWVLRLPSLLAGLLCIPAAFALGRRLAPPAGGLPLAALVAVDPLLVEQARTARMYSLLALLALLALVSLADLLAARRSGRWRWGLLGALLAALLWTHPLGLAVWVAAAVAILARFRDGIDPRGPLLTFGLAVGLGSMGLLSLAGRMWGGSGSEPPRVMGLEEAAAMTLERLSTVYGGGPVGWLALGVGLLGMAALLRTGRTRPLAVALLGLGLAGLAAAVLAAPRRPWGVERYLLLAHFAPHAGLAFVAAASPARIRFVVGAGLAALILGLGLAAMPGKHPPPRHAPGALARELAGRPAPEDAVTYLPTYLFRIGQYYGLPYRPVTLARAGGMSRPWEYPRTWVLVAHPSSLPTAVPGRPGRPRPRAQARLAAIFAAYGLAYDPAPIEAHLEKANALLVVVDPTGFRLLRLSQSALVEARGP